MSETALDALVSHLADAVKWNAAVDAPPVSLLWCDPASECASIIPALRTRLPQLLSLGSLTADPRTGPAFWLRSAAERNIPDVDFPDHEIPILWLPGVAREQLRGAEDCPAALAPLVWFAVAGQLYGHRNGKDWTLWSLFASDHGPLRLDIDDNPMSRAALSRAAPRLLNQPLSDLRRRHWDADALDATLVGDLDADMLEWIDGTFTLQTEPERFAAFAARAKRDFGVDPQAVGPEKAARLLAEQSGSWARVWKRFEGSTGYRGVVEKLSVLEAPADFLADASAYPRANLTAENELRRELSNLHKLELNVARERISQLEASHAIRRTGAWACRGMTPLASALEHLSIVASADALPDHDASELADAYSASGWRVDRAALSAYASAPREGDRRAVREALRALYLPWLEQACRALQELARNGQVPFAQAVEYSGPDTLVFVDGLRLDLARDLIDRLQSSGAEACLDWTWSGFPTVTATCKALASPVATKLAGGECGPDFLPKSSEGRPANKAVLDKLLVTAGWSVDELPLPGSPLWVEMGRFDTDGHALEDRLADQIDSAMDDLVQQLLALARTGRKLRIVTDHGWLWLPGGLPKAELPAGLAEDDGKRTRCALLKEGVEVRFARIPWTWNEEVRIAAASGACSFFKSYAYAHGGVSPQECILPVIDVEPVATGRLLRIVRTEWTALRLRVEVEGGADLSVDLRSPDGPSLLPALRALDEQGRTSFAVNADYEGQIAIFVVLDEDGRTLAERPLRVGQIDE